MRRPAVYEPLGKPGLRGFQGYKQEYFYNSGRSTDLFPHWHTLVVGRLPRQRRHDLAGWVLLTVGRQPEDWNGPLFLWSACPPKLENVGAGLKEMNENDYTVSAASFLGFWGAWMQVMEHRGVVWWNLKIC